MGEDAGDLSPSVLIRLRCPQCRQPIVAQNGRLWCVDGHELPRRDGYIDASNGTRDAMTTRTLESFGYQWNIFHHDVPEDEEFWQEYFTDVDLTELTGRVGLDAGCGKGRYSRFTARHVDTLVALDGSQAVVAAARNLAGLPNVAVVKADLRRAPFAEESFDFISCLGVLHHLADPEDGFRALTRLLAPGGMLLVYLYSRPSERGVRPSGLGAATALPRLTARLPFGVLRPLSKVMAAALYSGVVVPGQVGAAKGIRVLERLPLDAYRGRSVRALWLDTLDRLSAPVELRCSRLEAERWFRDTGIAVEAVSEDRGLTILGRRRPVGGARPARHASEE